MLLWLAPKTLNALIPFAMHRNKQKMEQRIVFIIAQVLFMSLIAPVLPSYPATQGIIEEIGHGDLSPIGMDELKALFSSKKTVRDAVINSQDLIEIIIKTNLPIKIENSILIGGLDMGRPAMPRIDMDRPSFELLPKSMDKKWYLKPGTQEWIARIRPTRAGKVVYIVENDISIRNSEIRNSDDSDLHDTGSAVRFMESNGYIPIIFSSSVKFSQVKFNGNVNCSHAAFVEGVDFSGSEFNKEANFNGTLFNSKVNFFGHATSGAFSGANFRGVANFMRAILARGADFSSSIFHKKASFIRASFHGGADLQAAYFNTLADFKSARFIKTLALNSTRFGQYADFRNSEIERLDFNNQASPIIIESRFDFRKAVIAEAHFQDIVFLNTVDFSDATFGSQSQSQSENTAGNSEIESKKNTVSTPRATVFRFVTFEDNASFLRTHFNGAVGFERVNFRNNASFMDAAFQGSKENGKPFLFSYVNFNDLKIQWHQMPAQAFWVRSDEKRVKSFVDIKAEKAAQQDAREAVRLGLKPLPPLFETESLQPLSQVFKAFETNLRDQNQLADANAAYYDLKLAELKESHTNKNKMQYLFTQLEWIFWGLSCGYGTKIWRILGWALLFNMIFTVIYTFTCEVKRLPYPGGQQEFTFRFRLLDFPKDYYNESDIVDEEKSKSNLENLGNRQELRAERGGEETFIRTFINALRFSSVLLFKVGYRDTSVSGRIAGLNPKFIVVLEWALGFYLLAALMVTLANTQPLINRLITGAF
jgi:uncharacterized protein YjbI with pentapeptide repeats